MTNTPCIGPGSNVMTNSRPSSSSISARPGTVQAVTFDINGVVSYLVTLSDEEKRTFLPADVQIDGAGSVWTFGPDPDASL
jgi:hypothetical protein